MATEPARTIVGLQVENLKRIKAVSIKPSKQGVVQITGKNGQGKTSIIDAIEYALSGGKSLPSEPVRRGTKKARTVVDLGDLVVERTFTPDGSQLVVRSAEGARFDKPQALLDRLVGVLTFDPLAFTRMKPSEQRDTLMRVAGLDFAELDAKRAGLFQDRTDVNRDAKRAQAQLDGMPIVSPKPERVDVQEATAAYRDAVAHNQTLADMRVELRELSTRQEHLERDAGVLQKRLEELRQQIKDTDAALDQVREIRLRVEREIDAFKPASVESIESRLKDAQSINRQADAYDARERQAQELEALLRRAEKLSNSIEDVDAEKQARIEAAKLPVPGLSVDERGVLLNDVPFEQASSAEQIRVSVAMAIAMNPKLRVMLVRDGSLLDGDSLAVLEGMAKEHGAQVWLERVDATGKVGVVIEDGEVKAVHAETHEPAGTPA